MYVQRDSRVRARRPLTRAGLVAVLALVSMPIGLAAAQQAPVKPVTQQATTTAPTTAPAAAPVETFGITGDTVVVADQDTGQLSVIEQGKARKIADGLAKPNGVVVLSDGSIVVADSGNNRLVGVGGRFGPALKEIVKLDFPYGLGVGANGTVYVTLLTKGEVGRVDLAAGKYTKIVDGIKGPGDVAVRAGLLYVPEAAEGGRDVVEITQEGKKNVVATGFDQPIGVVAGPGKSLYVSDFKANKIVKVDDDGKLSDFTKIDAPVQLTSVPWLTSATVPFSIVASAKEGVVRFDQTGKRTATTAYKGATGVGTLPVADPAALPTPTTVAPPTSTGPATTQGSTPRTTRPRSTTTSTAGSATGTTEAESSSGSAVPVILGIIGLAVIAGIVALFIRKPKTSAEAGFEERPLDTDTISDAFGPCAGEEVEVAEAEGARDAIIVQREASEKRLAEAGERVVAAEKAVAEAEAAAAAGGGSAAPEPAPKPDLTPETLGVETDEGREALARFAKGELDAAGLEQRWTELGEEKAIKAVRDLGEGVTGTGVDDAAADEVELDPVAKAQAQLAEAREDVEHATAEIERLNEREREAVERIDLARQRLETCQAAHREELAAKQKAAADKAAELKAAEDKVAEDKAAAQKAADDKAAERARQEAAKKAEAAQRPLTEEEKTAEVMKAVEAKRAADAKRAAAKPSGETPPSGEKPSGETPPSGEKPSSETPPSGDTPSGA